jgi:hypothetical protein
MEQNMKIKSPSRFLAAAVVTAAAMAAAPAHAEMSAEELAKLAQNPIANLISVPFQSNTNFNVGPLQGTQEVLNIQPVIPFELNSEWNVITRTIVPIIWNPALSPTIDSTSGLGDIVFSALLSPGKPGEFIWGAGPIFQLPTNSKPELGNKNWGMGLEGVVLRIEKGSPWVYGAIINNIWSLTSDKQGGSYSNFLLQPFVNYNIPDGDGLYLQTAPEFTASWKADSGQQWTVPLGGGVGKVFHFGRLPVNMHLTAYYNVVKPDYGSNWQIQLQMQFMFPK